MHRQILYNDEIRDSGDKTVSPGQVGFLNGWGVFSTLRVTDGVLFAYERHWARMTRDAKLMRVPFPEDPEWLRQRLLRLVEANQAANATLRVAVVRNHGGPYDSGVERAFDLIGFTTDFVQWRDSVRLDLKPHARHAACEFAGTKVLSWSHNLTWNEQARERGFDEVVLLNERGEVSECTSANIFAVQRDQVLTPPLSSGCLPGITRALLLEEVRVPGLTIREQTLTPSDLEQASGVFITSSTRDILPVQEVHGLRLRQEAESVTRELKYGLVQYRDAYVTHSLHRASVQHLTSV